MYKVKSQGNIHYMFNNTIKYVHMFVNFSICQKKYVVDCIYVCIS